MSTYTLLPAQRRFLHTDADVTLDVCIYQGGFGSGKTWVGSLLGILLCQQYPGVLGLCVAKTYPMVRDTTLRMYLDHVETLGLVAGEDYVFHKTESRLSFPCWGHSQILFRHLENPEKLKSLSVGWAQVEEISMITESDFFMLLSRLRQPGIPRYRLFGHTNPQPQKGWIWKHFVTDNPGKQTVVHDGKAAVIAYRRIIAPSNENIHLPSHYIDAMKTQFDDEYYRINVLGEDGDYTAGLVCKTWSAANIDDVEYCPDRRLYLACDFNVDPMSWVCAHRVDDAVHVFDEVVLPNTTTVEATDVFAQRYPQHHAGITITGDASGQNRSTQAAHLSHTNYTLIRNRLSELGFPDVRLDLPTKNPLVADRVAAWNAMTCNADGVVRVKVNPRCEWLVWNCENLKYIEGTSIIWEPTARMIQQTPNLKYTKHVWDAASYLIARYYPIRLSPLSERLGKPKMQPHPFRPRR